MPSGHMSEFPGSLPISISLGGSPWPNVAGPLTSRVSSVTAHTDAGPQGFGIQGVHP